MGIEKYVRFRPLLVWGVLFLLCGANGIVWFFAEASQQDGELTVTFLDVGQGDSIFIQTPNGRQVLIDGGGTKKVLRELGSALSPLDRSIDIVIGTHPDLDHIGGLGEVFSRYDVGMYIDSGFRETGALQEELLRSVEEEGISPLAVRTNDVIALDEGVFLYFLFPDRDISEGDTNLTSVVCKLVYGKTSFLFTGDAPESVESYLVYLFGNGLESDVLKVGHHGSKTSSSDGFVHAVSPDYAVISAGCDNTYGHPHEEVIQRFKKLDTEVLETCGEGSITFTSDGKGVHRLF